jgi:hypothetical protein
MTPTMRNRFILPILFVLLGFNVTAQTTKSNKATDSESKSAKPTTAAKTAPQATAPHGKPVLWRDPGAVERLDLVGGAAGRQGAPKAPFTFVEESLSGTNPKVKIKDANGVQWTMKFGTEVNAETFASRLVWAVGYFVEPAYYIASGNVAGVSGASFKRVKKDQLDPQTGQFMAARFERQKDKGVTKFEDAESWHWEQNPFAGTKELKGLRVMLMLLSNWDNKDVRDAGRGSNTSIFQYPNEARYLVTDWGGSMGKWGGFLSREKWDCKGFTSQSKDFVKGVKNGEVAFGYSGQHSSEFTKGVTPADVKWLLGYLGRVSDAQISAALGASGAMPEEVSCFTAALRQRIGQLKNVAQ